MEISIENEVVVITPAVNLVGDKNPELRSLLIEALEKDLDVMIDMSQVDIIDSCGISVIVAAYNSLKAKGFPLIIRGCCEDIETLFKIMRLDKHLTIR